MIPPAMTVRVMGYERLYLQDFKPKNGVYKYFDPFKSKGFPGLRIMFDTNENTWVASVDDKWEAAGATAQEAVDEVITLAAFDSLVARKEHQQ
jgi:hypothetical protein